MRSKVNIELWDLFIAIASLRLHNIMSIMTFSRVFKKRKQIFIFSHLEENLTLKLSVSWST